mgnify:CR=1 FL=1
MYGVNLFLFFFPEIFHPICHFLLLWTALCLPKACTLQCIGQKLLFDKMIGKIMCILISLSIANLLHQLGGSVTQVQRYWQIASFFDQL